MPVNTASFSLITGGAASTGLMIDPDKMDIQTIFYNFSGLAAGSTITMGLEARDAAGTWGYIIDQISITGTSQKNIATYTTPVANGLRGYISSVNNGSGYMYLDCFSD